MVQRIVKIESKYKVYVVGGGYEYLKMMWALGYEGAKGVGDAELVLFTGGADVCPDFYNEPSMKCTFFNRERDDHEKVIFDECVRNKIPMVGICRGGQFLNVMNGGKMYQDCNGHANGRNHPMHIINPGKEDRIIEVTSTHHQMMIPNAEKAEVLAVAAMATMKAEASQVLTLEKPELTDTEVVWYPETNSLCFQPHPEFGSAPKDCLSYFEELLDNYIIPMTFQKV